MSEKQNSSTTVEVIVPPNPLKDKVAVTGAGSFDPAPVERAEQALQQLSVAFDEWLKDEVATLSAARDQVHTSGLTDKTQEKLYLAAHDLKGQAETYGYPLIARVCTTLCSLLDATTQHDLIPLEIIDHHVNAVRTMTRMKIKVDTHPQSMAVSNKLREVVMEFVDHEAQKRQHLSPEPDEKSV